MLSKDEILNELTKLEKIINIDVNERNINDFIFKTMCDRGESLYNKYREILNIIEKIAKENSSEKIIEISSHIKLLISEFRNILHSIDNTGKPALIKLVDGINRYQKMINSDISEIRKLSTIRIKCASKK